jgi:hypothetical protein
MAVKKAEAKEDSQLTTDEEKQAEKYAATSPEDEGPWLIETYDTNSSQWEPSNLNAIKNLEWIRQAKVPNDPKVLRCPHSFDWCVETIKKSEQFHRDFNPVEYRLFNTESPEGKEEIIPCSIFMNT